MVSELTHEAHRLRKMGLSYPKIAAELGVSVTTLIKHLRPEYAEKQRQASLKWKHRNKQAVLQYDRDYMRRLDVRGSCVECGGPMGINKKRRDGRCRKCVVAQKEHNWRIVQRMWRDGASCQEIADALGWTVNHTNVQMTRMRKAGWDLPYRRPRKVAA